MRTTSMDATWSRTVSQSLVLTVALGLLVGMMACDGSGPTDTQPPEDDPPPSESSEATVTFDVSDKHQTVDGFGAGIKRQTRQLYTASSAIRDEVERLSFEELDVNMIRFFVYWDLEPENDNDDPSDLNPDALDWTRYESKPSVGRAKFVVEALNAAMSESTVGFDHIIGNANSAPAWLKTNESARNGGKLIEGGEDEYSEFLYAFLQGMENRYGIDVTAISPFNEPDFEVSYTSMDMGPEGVGSVMQNLDARLSAESMGEINTVAPSCFRVSPAPGGAQDKSTKYYISEMFEDPGVQQAVDVVSTHSYANLDHDADWSGLNSESEGKPVWVTESAVLRTADNSMDSAKHLIKWIINGFNEGGMTAYMYHLFYGRAEESGESSALIKFSSEDGVVIPKRYYAFKQFVNFVRPGYRRISLDIEEENTIGSAFISPDESRIVLEMLYEGYNTDESVVLDVPDGAQSISHYSTSNVTGQNASVVDDVKFDEGDTKAEIFFQPNSFHTVVIDF